MFRYLLNETKQPFRMFRNIFLSNFVLQNRPYSIKLMIKKSIPKTLSNLGPRPNKPQIFFIEYGHDGYQKIPLSMEISKSQLPWWQNVNRKSYRQKCYENLVIGPIKKAATFLLQNILLCTKLSWLFWNLYRKGVLLIPYPSWPYSLKKKLGLFGLA
jgi:hypothetical protein